MSSRFKFPHSLFVWLALMWLVGVVLTYYISHKPITPALALSLVQVIWQLLVALGIVTAAAGIGRRCISLESVHPLARLSLQASMGLGILSTMVLVFGALGGIKPILAGVSLVVILTIFWKDWRRWWGDWFKLISVWQQGGAIGHFIGICLVLIMSFGLVKALAPPLKFDALVYHLPLPHHYILAGRITYVPQIMYWGMPQNGEMLYTWAVLLAGDPAATALCWMFGILAMVGLLGYTAERFNTSSAWVCIACLICGFTLSDALSWGYVDWLVILLGFGFLVALDLWQKEEKRGFLYLAGVYAGLALGTKYTAGILLISGVVGVIWLSQSKDGIHKSILSAIQFALVAILISSPWWIKNVMATGNPFYPFFFPAGAMDPLRLALYQGGAHFDDWYKALLLPLRSTYLGAEMTPGYSASIGPLLLGFSGLAWLGWSSAVEQYQRIVKISALIVLPGLLTWMIAGQLANYLMQSRLYFAFFPAVAVLAGAGYYSISQRTLPGFHLGRIVNVLIVLVLVLDVIEAGITTLRQGPLTTILGYRSPEEYVADNLGWFGPAMQAIRDLPADAKVLMLWETRSLYCLPKCVPDVVLDRWLWERYGGNIAVPRGSMDILQRWIEGGYTHLLFYRAGADFLSQDGARYQPDDWQALEELLTRLTVIKEFDGTYTLYKLSP